MQREAPAYLRDVVEACDAIDSVLSGVEFDEYHATRMLRSSVEREFTIIGEAISVLSRTEPQLFTRITNGRRIVDFRNQLTHAYLQVDDRIVWLIARNDVPLLKALTHSIRWTVGIWFIIIGLLLLAAGAIVLGTAVWRSGAIHRWAGVPLAVGLVLYIPQFTGPKPIRVAHGVLMLAGCAWLGWSLLHDEPTPGRP